MEKTVATQPDLATKPQVSRVAIMRSMMTSILVNAILPFLIYTGLKSYTNISDFNALVASSIPSLIDSIIGIIRSRRIDILAAIVLIGIAASLIAIVLGGSPKLLLIRESFFTIAFGLTFLVSLLFPRPFIFYLARHFSTGNHPEQIPFFNSLWQYKGFRTNMRVTTVIWGVGLLIETAIRIYLVIILTPGQFLLVSPFVIYGILGVLALWTFLYSRQGRKRMEQRRQQLAAQQSETAVQKVHDQS